MTEKSASQIRNGGRATILDVARAAGVSRATAARALGGYGPVADSSMRRVLDAAEKLEYRSNELARAMRIGQTKTIGLVIADISSSFFDQATLAIIRTAALRGYQTLVLNSDESLEAEAGAVQVLLDKRVDGLIIVTSVRRGHSHLLAKGMPIVPLVFLDRRPDDIEACSVSTDDRAGAENAVEVFVRYGHKRIGMLSTSTTVAGQRLPYTSPQAISTMVDRVGGLISGVRKAGLEFRDGWLKFTDADHEVAKRAAIDLLRAEERPTAVLASNSETALAIIDACNDLGLRIGHDVSLIGFDDPSWARLMTPSLSVIARPVSDLGSFAVQRLIGQIQSPPGAASSIILPTRLVERESVGAPGS